MVLVNWSLQFSKLLFVTISFSSFPNFQNKWRTFKFRLYEGSPMNCYIVIFNFICVVEQLCCYFRTTQINAAMLLQTIHRTIAVLVNNCDVILYQCLTHLIYTHANIPIKLFTISNKITIHLKLCITLWALILHSRVIGNDSHPQQLTT